MNSDAAPKGGTPDSRPHPIPRRKSPLEPVGKVAQRRALARAVHEAIVRSRRPVQLPLPEPEP